MAILCGPITDTISYSNKLICGHLVKISDLKPLYGTIDILIDNQQVIPGIGSVSVAISPNFTERATINLIGKNVSTSTATISFAIESIEVPPPVTEATHYLDFYVKPYSWYTPGGAADSIVSKLTDISGKLSNLFTGITDYKYLGTEVLTEADKPGLVTIRLHLRQMSVMSGGINDIDINSMAAPLLAAIADIVFWLLVVIILIGVVSGWKFTLAGVIEQITGKKYSAQDMVAIVYDKVIPAQLDECNKNYPDPNSVAGCQKSTVCGAANGLTDALNMTGTDCVSLGINQKVDTCLSTYNIDGDKAKYDACVRGIAKAAGDETKKKAPKETDWTTILLFGAGFLGLAYIIKDSSKDSGGK